MGPQAQQSHQPGAGIPIGPAVDPAGPPVALEGAHDHFGVGVVRAGDGAGVAQPGQAGLEREHRRAPFADPDLGARRGGRVGPQAVAGLGQASPGKQLAIGLKATGGDVTKKTEFAAALEKAKIDSPRGTFTMSKAHNPVQDVYLRKVVGKENKVDGIAIKALADPARGCRM